MVVPQATRHTSVQHRASTKSEGKGRSPAMRGGGATDSPSRTHAGAGARAPELPPPPAVTHPEAVEISWLLPWSFLGVKQMHLGQGCPSACRSAGRAEKGLGPFARDGPRTWWAVRSHSAENSTLQKWEPVSSRDRQRPEPPDTLHRLSPRPPARLGGEGLSRSLPVPLPVVARPGLCLSEGRDPQKAGSCHVVTRGLGMSWREAREETVARVRPRGRVELPPRPPEGLLVPYLLCFSRSPLQ